jgi:GNAT superfamily N-acetyltransferase
MPLVQVTRTYLEMSSPAALRPAAPPDPAPLVTPLRECPVSFFRYLYIEVGRLHHWTDRLSWSDETVRRHLSDPAVSLWLLAWQGVPAGYFELARGGEAVEIAYFGLLPEYVGRGWGKYLLSEAVRAAWSLEPSRVWLHTCTLDHSAALPNYLARGFRKVREESYMVNVPDALAS